MTVRINHNIASLRTARTLSETDRRLAESLERLSSGFRINRGGDGPSSLIVSEHLRGQVASINQAIANTELATTMLQTAEGGLTQVNNLLLGMRQIALHAANAGTNGAETIEADSVEVRGALEAIDRVAGNTRFGQRSLLDGTSGVVGDVQGGGLIFLSANQRTRTAPLGGYPVIVTQVATRATLEGRSRFDASDLPGLTVNIFEGGRQIQVSADASDTPESFTGRLREAVEQAGVKVQVELEDRRLVLRHRDYGSAPTFTASSSKAGVISRDEGVLERPEPGLDIAGTIGGEGATGMGQVLTGMTGNENTEGLSIRYSGPRVRTRQTTRDGEPVWEYRPVVGTVGVVNVVSNPLEFQIGPNPGQRISASLPAINTRSLGRKVETETGIHSLGQISLSSPAAQRDAMRIIDSAIDELTTMRGAVGALQKSGLESNLNTLRVTAENLMAADSTIRDADMAKELVEYTKNRLKLEMNSALLAQGNQQAGTVINLIR